MPETDIVLDASKTRPKRDPYLSIIEDHITMPSQVFTFAEESADAASVIRIQQCDKVALDTPLEAGSVLVRSLAFPINPQDLMAIAGKYLVKPAYTHSDGSLTAGNDGVGRVERTGANVTSLSNQAIWSSQRNLARFCDPSCRCTYTDTFSDTASTCVVAEDWLCACLPAAGRHGDPAAWRLDCNQCGARSHSADGGTICTLPRVSCGRYHPRSQGNRS